MTPHAYYAIARAYAIQRDDDGHDCREIAFRNWCEEFVFARAVNRLVEQIGEVTRDSF